MIWLLVLVICAMVAYLLWVSSAPGSGADRMDEAPPTEAELLQARLDLLRVEQGIELALSKQEQREAAARTKQAIAEALEDER